MNHGRTCDSPDRLISRRDIFGDTSPTSGVASPLQATDVLISYHKNSEGVLVQHVGTRRDDPIFLMLPVEAEDGQMKSSSCNNARESLPTERHRAIDMRELWRLDEGAQLEKTRRRIAASDHAQSESSDAGKNKMS